jgi:uncharacterized hydantoinase/oxoprolinase family protein
MEAAHARLARMMCADSETCLPQVTMNLAQEVFHRQRTLLRSAVTHVSAQLPSPPRTIVISGSGEFLALQLVTDAEIISLAERLNPDLSSAACAYAVAMLVQEMLSR